MNNKFENIVILIVVVMLLLFPGNAAADVRSSIDNAVGQACQEIAGQLNASKLENINNIAVLPLWGDDKDGYILDTLKSYLSGSSYKIMVRSTEEWDKLLSEIKWNNLREDIMNPQTVKNFGRIEGCDAIVYGTVRQRDINSWTFHAIVRMTLNMANVETGQIVWSSRPVTASVWLEWPEMLQLAVHHPVVWVVLGLIILLIIWTVLKKMIRAATRPR